MDNGTDMADAGNEMFSTNFYEEDIHDWWIPSWARTIRIVYLVLISIAGSFGNSVILLVLYRNKRKSSTDWLVGVIALFDLMMATFCTSTNIVLLSTWMWTKLGSGGLCKFNRLFLVWTALSPMALLAAVSIDRYYKTCDPHHDKFTTYRAKVTCIVITVGGFVFSLPVIFMHGLLTNGRCGMNSVVSAYYAVCGVITCVAFVILVVCYGRIGIKLRKRAKSVCVVACTFSKQEDKNKKVTQIGNTVHHPKTREYDILHKPIKDSGPFLKTDSKAKPVTTQSPEYSTVKLSTIHVRSCNKPDTSSTSYKRGDMFVCKSQTGTGNMKETDVYPLEIDSVHHGHDRIERLDDVEPDEVGRGRIVHSADYHGPYSREKRRHVGIIARKINRTTRIMLLITLTCIVTWLILWILSALVLFCGLKQTVEGQVLFAFGRSLYMINCVANPIFYIALSSQFRRRTRELFYIK